MEIVKHNWPEGVDPGTLVDAGFTVFNGVYVYRFEELAYPDDVNRIFWEYRTDRRSWRKVMFGDNIWTSPYAPKPKGGGCNG